MFSLLEIVGLAAVAFFVSGMIGRDRATGGAPGIGILSGLLLGPLGLAVLDADSRPLLRPVLSLCVTWLGCLGGRRLWKTVAAGIGPREVSVALVETLVVLAAVAGGLRLLAPLAGPALSLADAVAVAVAVLASSRFVERFRWTLSDVQVEFARQVARVDAFLSLVALLLVGGWLAGPVLSAGPFRQAVWLPAACAVGLGILGGLMFILAMNGRATGPASAGHASGDRAFVVLIGVLLLGSGVSARLGAPELVFGTVVGVTAAASRGNQLLDDAFVSTERPMTLLAAVLIGATLKPDLTLLILAVSVVLLRGVAKVGAGVLGGRLAGIGTLGGTLLGYGGFGIAVAAQLSLSSDGFVGTLAAASAGALCLAGDALSVFGMLSGRRGSPPLEAAHV